MKKSISGMCLICFFFISSDSNASNSFNHLMLDNVNNIKNVDLSLFTDNVLLPGEYKVELSINGRNLGNELFMFFLDDKKLLPCATVKQLSDWGIKEKEIATLKVMDNSCVNLLSLPGTRVTFDQNRLSLAISIPQNLLSRVLKDVPPEYYNQGVNAFLLNYNLSASEYISQENTGAKNNNIYANLRPSINIGPWRFRSYTTWQQNSKDKNWQTVYSYAKRDIIPIKSSLLLGDGVSGSEVFDGISFRGASMISDEGMQPSSLQGYAPVVRGIARSNAEVVIRQNGFIIYQDSVSPGAFEITDLYSTGIGGDLNITVKESDGSEQNFIVPYASLPVLRRDGMFKYNLISGRYRSYDSTAEQFYFNEFSGSYGLPIGFTIFGGIQASSPYSAISLGVGSDLGIVGAVSADVITARSKTSYGEKVNGHSFRLRYNKGIPETGTSLSMAGYRYSSSNYYSMSELFDTYTNDWVGGSYQKRRNRAELTLSQQLFEGVGSVSLGVMKEDYWNSKDMYRGYQIAYYNSFKDVNFSLGYSRTLNKYRVMNDSLSLNVSLPLESTSGSAGYSMVRSDKKSTQSVAISGNALEENKLNWNIQHNLNKSFSTNANYNSSYAMMNFGFYDDEYQKRVNYAISGGIVAHSGGVTLGNTMAETVAIVDTSGVSGISINNFSAVKTDYLGYAIVPNVIPYRENYIYLDVLSANNYEFIDSVKKVFPTRGAVVKATYNVQGGKRALLTLSTSNGFVPFGAQVSQVSEKKMKTETVGEQGQVYMVGLETVGRLKVKWGVDTKKVCYVDYFLSKENLKAGMYFLSSKCIN